MKVLMGISRSRLLTIRLIKRKNGEMVIEGCLALPNYIVAIET